MSPAFDEILRADADTRSGLFATTAQRLGTTPQNVEKDLWVCWTLDALFNGLAGGPRLMFKGGTSLSKASGLINRFSEDIDVTVFGDDIGQQASVEELAALGTNKRMAALEAIRAACEAYINGPLSERLTAICAKTCQRTGIAANDLRMEPDPQDRQTLLLIYPSATPTDAYITKPVKIESGAKSALDPHSRRMIAPYVDADVPGIDLAVPNITVVNAERTFWDKVVILHGLRRWYDKRGQLHGNGQRVSRHYYDRKRPGCAGRPCTRPRLRCSCPYVLQSTRLRPGIRPPADLRAATNRSNDQGFAAGLSCDGRYDLWRCTPI